MILRRLFYIILALFTVFASGVAGYMIIERWSLLDALYMTVITLASVGFMEVNPLSSGGRIFTIFLIMGGTGILVYGVSMVIAFIVEGELTNALRRRRMQKKMDAMKDHFIVCGVGQTGKYALDEIIKTGRDVIAIERSPEKIKILEDRDICYVNGDATHNSVLQSAGIERAQGIVTAVHTDAENLLVVFTAKRLNPSIRVISKAVEEESEQKIRTAGADSVVMPNFIGGLRMASELIRPSVVSFLDIMLRSKDKTIRIEEVSIGSASQFIGRTLHDTGILKKKDVTMVALCRCAHSTYEFNPPDSSVLNSGDLLILMGDINVINEIRIAASA